MKANIDIKPENRRLLEAVEYIDEDIVLGVLSELKLPKAGSEKKSARIFRQAKHIALIAACALLLGAAIPIVNYILPMLGTAIGGSAGAGSSELETPVPTETVALETDPEITQTLETEPEITEAELIDSGFDKELERFADMSGAEIYAEVLKGGWVVIGEDRSDFAAGSELWLDFYEKSQKGESAVVLVAEYSPNYSRDGITEAVIFLKEIVFDGNLYNYKCIFSLTNEIDSQGEYKYLIKDNYGKIIHDEAYFLTNNNSWTWKAARHEMFSSTIPAVSFWNESDVLFVLTKYQNNQ